MLLGDETWMITGANGTIGSGLRAYLQTRVHHLVVPDRERPPNSGPNETSVVMDLREPDTLPAALEDVQGVVHLAGIADEAPYADLLEVNALGTYHLLEAMRAAGIYRLVYASSNRATGMHSPADVLEDRSVVRPDGLYGASKAEVC